MNGEAYKKYKHLLEPNNRYPKSEKCYVCDGKGSGEPDNPCPRCFKVGEVKV